MLQPSLFLFLLILLSACGGTKKTQNGGIVGCTHEVVVVDRTGLDGCGMQLRLPNGNHWVVVENKTGKSLSVGERWLIGAEAVTDYVSVCMAEQAAVIIHCQEKISLDCSKLRDPFSIPWLRQRLGDWQPNTITKVAYKADYLLLIATDKENMLYTCQGDLWCQGKGPKWAECLAEYQGNFGKGQIIYQGEGQID